MKGVSCTASSQHEICLICHLTCNNIFSRTALFFKKRVKTFRCGMVPFSFAIKMLYLAIRIHKSSILSVTTFALLPRITSSFEKKDISTMCEAGMKPSLYIKPVVLDFWAIPKHV